MDSAVLHRAVVVDVGMRLLFDGVKADGVNAALGESAAEAMSAAIATERMVAY